MKEIIQGDCADILPAFAGQNKFQLAYIDPPFGTGKIFSRKSEEGTRSYADIFDEEYIPWLRTRLGHIWEALSPTGSLMVHLDYRYVHYIKVELDLMVGRKRFMNEIIWHWDYGGRSKSRWSNKHNHILWYVKDPAKYTFNLQASDRLPYMAPGLVGPEKTKRGKLPTTAWWSTIVPTNSKENLRYPTQKPLAILNRIIKVHSNPGDWVLDAFAGSGTTGEAALLHNRHAVLIDQNPQAIQVIQKRLEAY